MKTITITLKQEGGAKELKFSTQIASELLSEISGTLAARIITLAQKVRKYKMDIGFSFSRKFDVCIEIDGQSTDGTTAILNGAVHFGITLQANEGSYTRFYAFIDELVYSLLIGANEIEGEFSEFLAELLPGQTN